MARQPDGARTSEVWTIPNIISVVRLAGVPLFLWLVIGPEADVWALVVLMISGFTDWLDGYLARRLNQMSKLGEILDPVADRLYILAAVVIVNPGGTGRPTPVISARFAPLPPRRSDWDLSPSAKSRTKELTPASCCLRDATGRAFSQR